ASTVPNLIAYDPAYAYELAVIIQDGLRRMYAENESIFYYISVYNENYEMPALPADAAQSILKGMYVVSSQEPSPSASGKTGSKRKDAARPQLFGSGPLVREALRAQRILADSYGVGSDVWSVTSYTELRRDALAAARDNHLHPEKPKQKSFLQTMLAGRSGPFVAVSDNVRLVPEQITRWIPGRYVVLGTDGFGRSDTRDALRRYFEIDAECIAYAALSAMAQDGDFDQRKLTKALKDLGIDPDKVNPTTPV
ncbi:MAG: pyruvate dehydrogenase (acetyl-transferring), homodimeric type, partial [Planctomycetes bacterium]|nr:pyruvate dehydrogenase (acetyl-transferring), homodimeric type [Planctomycetota bacterium]